MRTRVTKRRARSRVTPSSSAAAASRCYEGVMIPYFNLTAIHLTDSIALQPFGLLVGTGVLAGAELAKRRAREAGVDASEIRDAIFWALVPGFWIAHWIVLAFYHQEWVAE